MLYRDNIAIILLQYSLSSNISADIQCKQDNWEQVPWNKIYSFYSEHAIVPVVGNVVKCIPDEYSDIRARWKESIYFNLYYYSRLIEAQNQILNELRHNMIPTVILKGTSAAKYYPKPQLRTMGDIDLLVRPEDYERAVECLMNIGCKECTSRNESATGRHRSFRYKDTSIELHHFFSKRMDEKKAAALDELLYEAISCNSSELPDVENGLVLLAHIRQHLEEGLGLRQIIDWFMFVRVCLDDKMWHSSFQREARLLGMETIAITVTRMCQIYLGLTTENITWCQDADEAVCEDLMQYVMDCGNFGRSREMLRSGNTSKLPSIKQPIRLLKFLQFRGEYNWRALKKHSWLKPFAWVYQSCRYIKLAFQNKVTPNKLKSIYDEGNKRNEMFAALGLK